MGKTGFDNERYLSMQSEKIRERIGQFGGKLYLEFGGKLFDDYHASRVLPGFLPDSKVKMLLQLKDAAEIVVVINAGDIERSKMRGDLGITYDQDVLRLIDAFSGIGLLVGSVVITRYAGQAVADAFIKRLKSFGVNVFKHYGIPGYPADVPLIVSDGGYGKNEYITTSRELLVVTAPGPGSGKMAVCLSQLYHEHKRGIKAGYAKFETFPIWNLPLKHPVNLAYEAATADLDDVNMLDPFHLEAYGEPTVNYNRDVEIFPVLKAILEHVSGACPYNSPTDMGVNMAGYCIDDDEICRHAAQQEILRRYYARAVRPAPRAGTTAASIRSNSSSSRRRSGPRIAAWSSPRSKKPLRPASPPPRSNCRTAPSSPARRRRCWARRPALLLNAPQEAREHSRRYPPDFAHRARADTDAQGPPPRQPQPAPTYGRDADRPVHQRGHEPDRRYRAADAPEAARLRSAFDRDPLAR